VAWINTIDQPEARSDLARIYEEQQRQAGAVANILKIHSLAPEVLAAHLALYKAALHTPGELSRRDREMIAVTVARVNICGY
jgi:alkylhydroperoxidase family enzyme